MRKLRLSTFLKIGLVATVAALVVAACGGSDPTAAPAQVIVHTPTPAAAPTAATIVQTATPVPSGPTPTPRVIVQTATPTATPNVGAITQEIKGWRPIQGNDLSSWRVAPQRGGTFSYGFPSKNRGTDSVVSQSYTVAIVTTPVTNVLVRCMPAIYMKVGDIGYCEPQGDLASSWSTADGGKTWQFKINVGAKWQTPPTTARGYTDQLSGLYGRGLTVEDVLHSTQYWRSLLTKSDGSPQPTAQGNKHFTSQIVDVRKVDDETIEFELVQPDPKYPTLLADWRARVYPPEVFELDGDHTQRLVGTGPFIIDQYDPAVEVTFVAHNDYFKDGADGSPFPYLDGYRLILGMDATLGRSAMITGKLDMHQQNLGLSTPSAAVNFGRQCPSCTIVESFQPWRNFSIGFRTDGADAPFADPRARLAIAKAVDLQGIIDGVFEGAASIVPVTGAWGTFFDEMPTLREMGGSLPDDENPYVFDPDLAKQLWADSGHSAGEEHEIIYYQYSATNTNNVVAVAAELEKNLDITVKVNRSSSIGTFYTAIGYLKPPHQQFPSMAMYVQGPRVSPAAWAANTVGAGAANLENRQNAKLESIVAEWLLTGDAAKERELAKQWYAEIINDFRNFATPQPAFYHVESSRTRNMYEFRLAGIQLHQGGWHLEYVWVTQD